MTSFKAGTFKKQSYKTVLQIPPVPKASLKLDFWIRQHLFHWIMSSRMYISIFFLLPLNKALHFISMTHMKATQSHLASWKLQHRLGWTSNGIGMINLKLFGFPLCSRKHKWITECRRIRVAPLLIKVNLPHSIGNFYTAYLPGKAGLAKRQLEGKNNPLDVFVFQEYFGRNKYRFWCSKRQITLPAPRAGNRLINGL